MWSGRELEQKVALALDSIGKGAAALSQAGSAMYAMSNAMQNQGLQGLLQPEMWKQGSKSARAPRATKSALVPFEPGDVEEKRAIIKIRLDRAIQMQDAPRAQQLARELDELEGPPSGSDTMHPPNVNVAMDQFSCHFPGAPSIAPAVQMPFAQMPSVQPAPKPLQEEAGASCQGEHCPIDGRRLTEPSLPANAAQSGRLAVQPTTTSFACPRPLNPYHDQSHPHPRSYAPSACHVLCPRSCPYHLHCPHATCFSAFGSCQNARFGDVYEMSEPFGAAFAAHPASFMSNSQPREAFASPTYTNLPGTHSGGVDRSMTAGASARGHTCHSEMDALHTASVSVMTVRKNARVQELDAASAQLARQPLRMCSAGPGDMSHVPQSSETLATSLSTAISTRPSALDTPGSMDTQPPMLLLQMHTPVPAEDHVEPPEAAMTAGTPITKPVGPCVGISEEQHHLSEEEPVQGNAQVLQLGAPLQDIYEVEHVLDMRWTVDGKREFLIKWRGWGPSWNNWEPEEHILDRRMLRKFDKKRPNDSESATPLLDEADDFTMQSKRRCAKRAALKARMAAREEQVNHK